MFCTQLSHRSTTSTWARHGLMVVILIGLMLTSEKVLGATIWVDLAYLGPESGTYDEPYNTVGEALTAASSGDSINIKGDSEVTVSHEAPLTFLGVTLNAVNGSVSLAVPIEEIVIEPLPSPFYYGTSTGSRELKCVVSGGVAPYEFQWESSPDGLGSWDPLAENPGLIEGTQTDTLVFKGYPELAEHYLRCQVTDRQDTYDTNVSYVDVIECEEWDPPPGIFTDQTNALKWGVVDTFNQWAYVGGVGDHRVDFTTCSVGCGDSYGSISTTAGYPTPEPVTIPVSHSQVKITFPTLSDNLEVRFSWGEGADNSCQFIVADGWPWQQECYASVTYSATDGYEASFYVKPSWHDGSEVNGFYTRHLKLEFLTGGLGSTVSGSITRIDMLPGPYIQFTGEPDLLTTQDIDPVEAQTFGAGAELELYQGYRNSGCDLNEDPNQRLLTYTFCKVGTQQCDSEALTCNRASGGSGEAVVTVSTAQPPVIDPPVQHPCDLILPDAGANNENLGLWEIKGTFDSHQEEVITRRILLQEFGMPDLKIDRESTAEAGYGTRTDFTQTGWLERNRPFSLSFHIRSEQYPVSDGQYDWVPIEISATSIVYRDTGVETLGPVIIRKQGQQSGTGPTHLEPTPIGPSHNVFISNLLITEALLPMDASWALLSLSITLDPTSDSAPYGVVDEIGSETGGHTLPLTAWLPVIAGGDIDTVIGSPIANLHDDFDGSGTGPMVTPDFEQGVNWQELTGRVQASYNPSDPTPPYIAWQRDSELPIGGVMVRYLRRDGDNAPRLLCGACSGEHEAGGDLTGSELNTYWDSQWHMAVWKRSGDNPFDQLPSDKASPLANVSCTPAAGKVTLYMAVEPVAVLGSYPTTDIDYIRVWDNETPPPVWNATVQGLVYNDGGGWVDMPDSVSSGDLNLGLAVSGLADHLDMVTAVNVTLEETTNPGVVETLTVGTEEILADQRVVYPLTDSDGLLPTWSIDGSGSATFSSEIVIDDPLENNPDDNAKVIEISFGCLPRLSLPVAITETR